MPEATPHASLAPVPPRTKVVGSRIVTFAEVASTNDIALRTSGDGVTIVADAQTSGRGRLGRAWQSRPGLGVWCSVGLDGGDLEGMPFAAALAVRDALRPRCAAEVKWPNDLLLNGRKFCGILIDRRDNRTAVGIGINVGHTDEDFPPELRGVATSLRCETGEQWERAEILHALLTEFDRRVVALRAGAAREIAAEWSAACGIVGQRITADAVSGVVRAVRPSGALEVQTAQGTVLVTAADRVVQHKD